jgi:gamma-glutamyltranspeptidase / glutathione hydrolase
MLDAAHKDAGRLTWKELFDPAIRIATDGFNISPRMAASVAGSANDLVRDPDARAYFLNADGTAKAAGTLLRSPALATTFQAIAERHFGLLQRPHRPGHRRQDRRHHRRHHPRPDNAGRPGGLPFEKARRHLHALPRRVGVRHAAAQQRRPGGGADAGHPAELRPVARTSPRRWTTTAASPRCLWCAPGVEAQRLAYADRNKYVADTDFVPLPGGSPAAMLDTNLPAHRASLISLTRSMGTAQPGNLGPVPLGQHGPSARERHHAGDGGRRRGQVVSLTTTIESAFGAFHMTKRRLPAEQPAHRLLVRTRGRRACPWPTAWPPASARAARWRRRWCSASGRRHAWAASAWPPARRAAPPSSSLW